LPVRAHGGEDVVYADVAVWRGEVPGVRAGEAAAIDRREIAGIACAYVLSRNDGEDAVCTIMPVAGRVEVVPRMDWIALAAEMSVGPELPSIMAAVAVWVLVAARIAERRM